MFAPRLLVATAFALLVGATLAPSAVAQEAPSAAAVARWPSLADVPSKAPGGGQDDAAVVIGIEKYAFLTGIPGAKANALAWERWMRDVRQVPGERVHVLTDNDGTREKILTHVRKAAAGVQKGGTLWIVFIGHGAPSRDKRADGQDDGVLVGVDAQQDPDGFYVRAVAQGDVVGVAREAAARGANPVVILDACFSGQDASGASLLPGRMVALPASLARVADVMVLSAGRAKEMAGPLPGPADRPRPAFSYLLLGGLRGWADAGAPGDGRVTPGEALTYVRTVFNKLDPTRSQTPECYPEKLCARPLARSAGEKSPDLGALASSMSGGAGNANGQYFQPFQPFDGGLDYGENIQNTVVDDTGFLLVTSEPSGATVMLNGKEVGKTPFQKEVMVGRYRIVLEGVALHHAHQEEITLTTAGAKKRVTLRPAFGRLVVETTPPGARVSIDGADAGAGPYTDPRRRSGRYEIRAAADLYLSARQTVEVTDGQETRVSLRLEPNFGALRVESTPPGGEILLDGAETGQVTPYTFERKQVGTYAISVRRTGYGERGGKASVRVGATETLALTLEAKLGLLSVTSLDGEGAPCEGALTVDGVAKGTTPTKVQLTEGRHEVTVKCGASEGRETVQIGHNEKGRVEVRMPARARPRPSEDQPAAGGFSETSAPGDAPAGYVAIPAGEFLMGSPSGEEGRDSDEKQHRVRITRGFYLKATEVTQGEWEAVMGSNPSSFKSCGKTCPVENVSWNDAVTYLNKLSDRERLPRCYDASGTFVGLSCKGYRLPTEAEWEYAARAGTTGAVYAGTWDIVGKNNAPALGPIAWYGGNSGVSYGGAVDCGDWPEKQEASSKCGTHPVGQKRPNAWGLYDMLGNVWEWTNDWYGDYPGGTVTDPVGEASGVFRVYRGGSWVDLARYARAADRAGYTPDRRGYYLGFRPLRAR
jgi:formylglycine-generating enzyme required for sulfatase activity